MFLKNIVKNFYWALIRAKHGNGFKTFGYRSDIIKPDRIIGKKFISIGGVLRYYIIVG